MQPGDYTQVIYDRGCLRSGEEWVERNLVPVAAVAVALAVLQVSFLYQSHYFFLFIYACFCFALLDFCSFFLLAR